MIDETTVLRCYSMIQTTVMFSCFTLNHLFHRRIIPWLRNKSGHHLPEFLIVPELLQPPKCAL
jgi:hypothetical protein